MLHAISSAFLGIATFISSLFGAAPAPLQAPAPQTLGAALPSGTAVFETSLQSRISATDASMALVSNSVRGGSSLSGYNCFTIDEGRTDAEYVCGTVSGTSVTSLARGIDPASGTSTNSALKFAHRVGANVKITDFPLLQILRNQAAGADTYEHALTYATGVTPANTGDLTDKEYVDGLAFSGAGVINASSIAKGVVELATGAEAAASAANGGSGPLVLPASAATSTWNSATAGNVVPVTGLSTKRLDPAFVFGVAATLPSSQGASSTVLSPDGSGNFSYVPLPLNVIAAAGSSAATTSTASTTLATVAIPANSMASSNRSLEISGLFSNIIPSGGGTVCTAEIAIGNGAATTTLGSTTYKPLGNMASIAGTLYATSTSNLFGLFRASSSGPSNDGGAGLPVTPVDANFAMTASYSLTSPLYVAFISRSNSGTASCALLGKTVRVFIR